MLAIQPGFQPRKVTGTSGHLTHISVTGLHLAPFLGHYRLCLSCFGRAHALLLLSICTIISDQVTSDAGVDHLIPAFTPVGRPRWRPGRGRGNLERWEHASVWALAAEYRAQFGGLWRGLIRALGAHLTFVRFRLRGVILFTFTISICLIDGDLNLRVFCLNRHNLFSLRPKIGKPLAKSFIILIPAILNDVRFDAWHFWLCRLVGWDTREHFSRDYLSFFQNLNLLLFAVQVSGKKIWLFEYLTLRIFL